jgi:hypothetical protein
MAEEGPPEVPDPRVGQVQPPEDATDPLTRHADYFHVGSGNLIKHRNITANEYDGANRLTLAG